MPIKYKRIPSGTAVSFGEVLEMRQSQENKGSL